MIKTLLLFIFLFTLGCKKEERSILVPMESPLPLQKIENFNLEGYGEGGKKDWELEAESADLEEKIVKMEGVVIRTSEGTKLTTEKLTWDTEKKLGVTKEEVFIERDNLTVQGKGGVSLPEMKKVRLEKEVEVNVKPKTTITCDGPLELDYEKNVSIFYDKVKVEDEEGLLFADKMEVYFHPQEKVVERVFAYGNVKIVRGENTAYADEAFYDAKEQKVILRGNPRLVIYPQE